MENRQELIDLPHPLVMQNFHARSLNINLMNQILLPVDHLVPDNRAGSAETQELTPKNEETR